ncbi:MAG: hypothetical protein ABIS47_10165 [Acidimicrobiales bacterium]
MAAASGRAKGVGRRPAPAADPGALAYNDLPRVEQKLLRRTVRMGRPMASRDEAGMAVAFARYQRTQPWYKLFWVLFIPGLVVSLAVASTLHLAVVGIVLAVAAQGAWGWISLRRVEKVNRHLLGGAA